MALQMKPVRRVVTGNDAAGRSKVLFDGAAPSVHVGKVAASAGMTEVWVFDCPATIMGERDDGNLPFSFEPPEHGGRGRRGGYQHRVGVHRPCDEPGDHLTWRSSTR